jgi:hypothetical protein
MHIIETQGETHAHLTSPPLTGLGICGFLLKACLEVYAIGVVRDAVDSP